MTKSTNPFELISEQLQSIERSNRRIELELQSLKVGCDNYTRHEASQVLNVSLSTIDRLIKDQKVTRIKVGSKTLIPRKQVDDLAGGQSFWNLDKRA